MRGACLDHDGDDGNGDDDSDNNDNGAMITTIIFMRHVVFIARQTSDRIHTNKMIHDASGSRQC